MARILAKHPGLNGRSIFVVEDDCVTAMDLAETLTAAGARIVGPATTIRTALELLQHRPQVDIALLDLEIEGDFVFGVADQLVASGVPIVFMTGYERSELPPRFRTVPHCEKPITIGAVARTLDDELAQHAQRALRPRTPPPTAKESSDRTSG